MNAHRFALNSVLIVLVRPESAANVGAVARIVRNFGFAGLRIVGEPVHDHPEAKRLAHRSIFVLSKARTYPDLAAALDGCAWAVGTSGRIRRRGPVAAPIRSVASAIVRKAEGTVGALVFGPESDGLSFNDLSLCDDVVRIPQCTPGPALNLSQAVAICGAELFQAALVPGSLAPPAAVGREERERLTGRMARLARHCGLPVRNRPEEFHEAIRRMVGNHDFSSRELATIEKILAQVEWFVGLTTVVPSAGAGESDA